MAGDNLDMVIGADQSVQRDSLASGSHYAKAMEAEDQGDRDAMIAELRKSVAADPHNNDAMFRLAYELEVGLMETANQLAAGEQAKALERVRGLQRLLAGVQIEIPGFEGHREIELDRQMVWLFADLIEKSLGDRSWTDALRYAALRKRLPAPEAL